MSAAALNAQIAARTAAAITEALDQLANGWTDQEVLVVALDAWRTIADLKDQRDAHLELAGLLCTRCDKSLLAAYVTDPQQEAWLGSGADRWCSTECRDADAEAYWTARWSAA